MTIAIDLLPQDRVAAAFMERKGYRNIRPRQVEQVERYVWEYEYDIDDGLLVLEVAYDGDWGAEILDYVR